MRSRLLPLFLLPLLMVGCATVSTTPVASPQERAADALLTDGKYREAAQAWQTIADGARSPQRDRALTHAADAWERAGDGKLARQVLAQANRRKLLGDDALLHDLLGAQFLIEGGRAADAVSLLAQPRDSVPEVLRTRWHSLRARAFEATDRSFDLAGEHAWLMQGLPGKERSAAGRNIERLLARLDSATLAQRSAGIAANDPLYPFAARELAKRGLPLPHPLARSSVARTDAFPPADGDGYRPPAQLAVLLPMSGNLASAGAGVRDGILAAYYAEKRRRPTLRFYDSAGTAAGAQKAAAQAVADGAQLILGPLAREEVGGVFEHGDIGVGVIALNRGQNPPPGSLNFALAPEEEGLVAADRCGDRGQLKVWVFSQRDENSQRALAAFRDQLRARGGEVVGETVVTDTVGDIGASLQAQLAQAKAAPTAVYMPLKAAPARLLAAQLKTSPLAALPRLSSTLIVSGANTRQDVELDGIEYPELPWLLDQRPELPDADALARSLPSARGQSQRLFAFGMDAWKLAAYLDRLGNDPGFSLLGATGELRIDNFGTVQRAPAWAVFSGGRARPAPDRALRTEPPAGR